MKNQLDLIVSLSALIIALVFAGYFYSTKRAPAPPGQVVQVKLDPVKLPAVPIEMTNGIAGSKQAPGGGGGGGGGGGAGGARAARR